MTVEDPNENFDDLRDRCDLKMLLKDRVLEGRKAPLSKEIMNEIGVNYKLSKVGTCPFDRSENLTINMKQRQLERCCEMLLYKQLNKRNAFDYRDYRLFVKRRLYIRNLVITSCQFLDLQN